MGEKTALSARGAGLQPSVGDVTRHAVAHLSRSIHFLHMACCREAFAEVSEAPRRVQIPGCAFYNYFKLGDLIQIVLKEKKAAATQYARLRRERHYRTKPRRWWPYMKSNKEVIL